MRKVETNPAERRRSSMALTATLKLVLLWDRLSIKRDAMRINQNNGTKLIWETRKKMCNLRPGLCFLQCPRIGESGKEEVHCGEVLVLVAESLQPSHKRNGSREIWESTKQRRAQFCCCRPSRATKVKVFISRNTNQMMPFIYVQAQNTIKCPQQ